MTDAPIPLSREMITAVQDWAADDRLWSTKETTEFNLYTFARLMLKLQAAALRGVARGETPTNDHGAELAAVPTIPQSLSDYRQATTEERAMARGFVTLWQSVGVQDAEDWLYALRNRAELLATLDEDDSSAAAGETPTEEKDDQGTREGVDG